MAKKFKREKDHVEQDGRGTPEQKRRNLIILKTVEGSISAAWCGGASKVKGRQGEKKTEGDPCSCIKQMGQKGKGELI